MDSFYLLSGSEPRRPKGVTITSAPGTHYPQALPGQTGRQGRQLVRDQTGLSSFRFMAPLDSFLLSSCVTERVRAKTIIAAPGTHYPQALPGQTGRQGRQLVRDQTGLSSFRFMAPLDSFLLSSCVTERVRAKTIIAAPGTHYPQALPAASRPSCHRQLGFKLFDSVRHKKKSRYSIGVPAFLGAGNRNRTGTLFTARDFKSLVSTYSTIPAALP